MTISGYVIPLRWDECGKVTQVYILTDWFEKIIVASGGMVNDLIEERYQYAHVTCQCIGEDSMGNKIIKINNILKIQP